MNKLNLKFYKQQSLINKNQTSEFFQTIQTGCILNKDFLWFYKNKVTGLLKSLNFKLIVYSWNTLMYLFDEMQNFH